MAADDEERPERPDYNVYRGGKGRRGGKSAAGSGAKKGAKRDAKARGKAAPRGAKATAQGGKGTPKGGKASPKKRARGGGQGADYSVYRSSRNPFRRLGGADLGAKREALGEQRKAERREQVRADTPRPRPPWRRSLRFALIGAGCWILLSVVVFGVSAQIQKGKLNAAAASQLGGFPLLVASPQTILVMGTDARPVGTNEPGAETNAKCIEGAAAGDPPDAGCQPFRADTLMLVRAGGGKFNKLSIPRDAYAAIPGQSAQKINAGYAFGGATLQILAVEEFLGIEVDHTVILDFEGFADFIDAIGGVEVNLRERVKSKISGGAANGGVTLKLPVGPSTLNGQQALALARTRSNLRNPGDSDIERAERQQLILKGIKSRLTSPWRSPINFVRGPWIAWNAPKAMVSDMGAFVLPQLALASAIGGDNGTKVLVPSGTGPGGSLIISGDQCRKAVKKFLGEDGPREPACSPVG